MTAPSAERLAYIRTVAAEFFSTCGEGPDPYGCLRDALAALDAATARAEKAEKAAASAAIQSLNEVAAERYAHMATARSRDEATAALAA